MKSCVYLFLFAAMTISAATGAQAAVIVENVNFGGTPAEAQGRYRVRDDISLPKIATLAIHRTADYRDHASAEELAERGFGTLGMSTRFRVGGGGNNAAVDFEQIALDIRNGIRFLRNKGHEKIILIGHSGGGPSTSYYQALLENGPSYCQGRNKITECPFTGDEFDPEDKADGIVFLDSHPGVGVNQLRSLNGSVVNENDPFGPSNPTLDPFDPDHGYNEDGNSSYTDFFIDRYSMAQARRMNGLIKEAQLLKRKIELGLVETADVNDLTQHLFPIFRANARMVQLSRDVQCCTENPTRLLMTDGTITAGDDVVETVRVPNPGIRDDDQDPEEFEDLSLTSFLSANAIRSKHTLDESKIDWCSTNNSTPCAVEQIHVPVLVVAMQGHYFIRDGEFIYESSASEDKEFLVMQGATHGMGNCNNCDGGPYSNVRDTLFDYVADWLNEPERFDE